MYGGESSVIALFDGVTSDMQVLSAKLDHVEVTLSPLSALRPFFSLFALHFVRGKLLNFVPGSVHQDTYK